MGILSSAAFVIKQSKGIRKFHVCVNETRVTYGMNSSQYTALGTKTVKKFFKEASAEKFKKFYNAKYYIDKQKSF